MTTPNEAREAVYARFNTEFGTGSVNGAVPFQFEDEAFDEPNGTWMRLTIVTTSRLQDTLGPIGSRKYFSNGSILCQIYTRRDQGTREAELLAKRVIDLFEGVSFSGVNGNSAIAREQPPEGRWYFIVCEIEFTYDETK